MTRRDLLKALIPLRRAEGRQCLLNRSESGQYFLTLYGSNGSVQIAFGTDARAACDFAYRFMVADLT